MSTRPGHFDLRRRQFLAGLVGLGLSVPLGSSLLAGCGGAGSAGSGSSSSASSLAPVVVTDPADPRSTRRKVLDSFYTLQNDYFQSWDRAFKDVCSVYNLDGSLQVDNSNVDTLRSIFDAAAQQGVQGIVCAPAVAASTPSILGLAQKAGIYTATAWSNAVWSTPLDIGDKIVTYLAGNDPAIAKAAAIVLFKTMNGQGKFIHVSGQAGNSASDQREFGVDEALKEYPGIQMIDRQYGGFSRTVTQPVIEGMLTAHPDVQGILCSNDDSAIAVLNALRARQMKVPVVGIDTINEFLDAMQQGDTNALATVATHGDWLGAYLMVRVFDEMAGYQSTTPERMMYFGTFVVDTPEAAKSYQQLVYKNDKLPFDYEMWSRVLHPEDWDPQNALAPMDPEVYWAQTPKPAGYSLPAPYAQAMSDGSFDAVTAEYKAAFKSDPFAETRKLCKLGGQDIL